MGTAPEDRTRGRSARADADLDRIAAFAELIVSSARSSNQRERLVRAAGIPVTGAHLAVLRAVGNAGTITASDVAARLTLDQSTTSRHLRALEDQGLVTRRPDERDRRVAHVELTDQGAKALAAIHEVSRNDFDVAMASWSASDRHQLALLLGRLQEDLLAAGTDETGWAVRPDPT